ncbi:Gfo/Idh/MocA family protein [Kitasatospora sp. NBC_01266]|uniref:Gfo/Idh/MocA family protein n=1 Tax=Kitasatospora sp. NBC_01266 TaxID=2903572 RepID=UPI002E336B56|nr:Gfo/Idh/MocA family oxidoreductase [Kitasatospora sp. NBC_01266]
MTQLARIPEVLSNRPAGPMGDSPLSVVVVGHGRWGANHARAVTDAHGVRLQGVVDPRPEARDLARQRYGVPVWSTLAHALDDDRVEAVVIATPAHTHADMVGAALRAGRHVLVEKPAATSTADAEAMVAEADERGLQVSVGHTFLYTQPVRNLARWLWEGAPSTPWLLRSERLGGQRRPDCDVLWNFGPHDVSILLHLMAEPVLKVAARGHRFPSGRHLDAVTLDLEFASGVRGEVYLGWRHPGAKRSLRVLGEDWAVTYRHGHVNGEDTLTRTGAQSSPGSDNVLVDGCNQGPRSGSLHGYREPLKVELEEFAVACRTGRPTVTGPDHLVAVTSVLEAAARSTARDGQAEVPDRAAVASRRPQLGRR